MNTNSINAIKKMTAIQFLALSILTIFSCNGKQSKLPIDNDDVVHGKPSLASVIGKNEDEIIETEAISQILMGLHYQNGDTLCVELNSMPTVDQLRFFHKAGPYIYSGIKCPDKRYNTVAIMGYNIPEQDVIRLTWVKTCGFSCLFQGKIEFRKFKNSWLPTKFSTLIVS